MDLSLCTPPPKTVKNVVKNSKPVRKSLDFYPSHLAQTISLKQTMITLKINGQTHQLDVEPDTPLLWVIREHLGLTGTKYSCGIAECGNCTVLIDGEPGLSCTIAVADVDGQDIITIEGLNGKYAESVRKAWLEEDVPQCGYCQSGQIIAATSLLTENPDPNNEEIDEAMSGILCRCGTYPTIRRAIRKAAKEVQS